MWTYHDLLNPDLSTNTAAFDQILANRIAAEINLQLCGLAGLHCPRGLLYSEVRPWYAAQAALLDPTTLSFHKRFDIMERERRELTEIVSAMFCGAERQRKAMVA